MADNYLERKMDDYRSGTVSRRKAPGGTRTLPKGKTAIAFEPKRILICGDGSNIDQSIITKLREVDCRVAFMCIDESRGREIAQAHGAQHHPFAPDSIESITRSLNIVYKHWGGADMVILTEPHQAIIDQISALHFDGNVIVVCREDRDIFVDDPAHLITFSDKANGYCEAVATACRFLCEPAIKCPIWIKF